MNHFLFKGSIFIDGNLFFELFNFAFVRHFYMKKFENLVRSFLEFSNRSQNVQISNFRAVLLDFNKEYLYQSLQLAYTNQSRRECFFIIETMAKCAIIFVMLFCHGQREMNLYSYTVVWMIAILCLLNGLLLAKISSFHLLNEHLFSLMISWQCRFQFQRSRKPSFHHKLYRYFPPINEIKRNFFIQSVAKNPIGFTCGRYFRITKLKYIELQLMNGVLLILFHKRFLL